MINFKRWIKIQWRRFKVAVIAVVGISIAAAAPAVLDRGPVEEVVGERTYIPAEHNLDRVRFKEVREKIDARYRDAHDSLSAAYYEGEPFVWGGVDYGILDEPTFQKLQALIWDEYLVLFDEENKKLPEKERIPTNEYDAVRDENGDIDRSKTQSSEARARIKKANDDESIKISI